jgi:hypothetical protein
MRVEPFVPANAGQAPPASADARYPAWLHSLLRVLMRTAMKKTLLTLACTICLVLLADCTEEIGERIPQVLLSVWAGSATLVALVFSDRRVAPALAQSAVTGSKAWGDKMRLIGVALLPLAFVPLLEIRHSGYDPALWLMNGILIVSVCSVPYFWLLARGIVGAVALNICCFSLLWHFAAWGLFMIIKRMETAKEVSTVDTSHTFHAFLAPEYRIFLYGLCGAALLVYCPVMMSLGYRRFLRDQPARPGRGNGDSAHRQQDGNGNLPGSIRSPRLT